MDTLETYLKTWRDFGCFDGPVYKLRRVRHVMFRVKMGVKEIQQLEEFFVDLLRWNRSFEAICKDCRKCHHKLLFEYSLEKYLKVLKKRIRAISILKNTI
jgi:hypothetical protein